MHSDKEVKKLFKKKISKDPSKYFAIDVLKKEGFARKQCSCGTYFWTVTDSDVCGDPACAGGFSFFGNSPAKKKLDYIEVWKEFSRMFSKAGYTPIDRYPVVARWRDDTDFVQACRGSGRLTGVCGCLAHLLHNLGHCLGQIANLGSPVANASGVERLPYRIDDSGFPALRSGRAVEFPPHPCGHLKEGFAGLAIRKPKTVQQPITELALMLGLFRVQVLTSPVGQCGTDAFAKCLDCEEPAQVLLAGLERLFGRYCDAAELPAEAQ